MKYPIVLISLIFALLVGAVIGADAHPKPPCLRGRCYPTATLTRTPVPTATKTPAGRHIIECFRYPCPTAWAYTPKVPKVK